LENFQIHPLNSKKIDSSLTVDVGFEIVFRDTQARDYILVCKVTKCPNFLFFFSIPFDFIFISPVFLKDQEDQENWIKAIKKASRYSLKKEIEELEREKKKLLKQAKEDLKKKTQLQQNASERDAEGDLSRKAEDEEEEEEEGREEEDDFD